MTPFLLLRFAPYLIAGAALIGSHWWAYSKGAAGERAEWSAKWAQRDLADAKGATANAEHIAALERKHRTTEATWQSKLNKARNANTLAQARIASDLDGARTELARLRASALSLTCAPVRLPGASSSASAPGADDAATAGNVLAACASALVDVAADADRWQAEAVMLRQGWPK
jgi:hypothetical protein